MPLHPPQPSVYPIGLHVRLEAAQFVVSDAPGHYDLRAFVVLLMVVLGQGRDGIPGVLQLHIPQQRVGYLLVETLWGWGVQSWWVVLGIQQETHSQSGVSGSLLYRRNCRLRA